MSKVLKLKDIADVITGFPFKGELYSNSGIRTVRGENVTEGKLRWDTIKCWNEHFDKKEEYSLKENDVVIGMDGSKVGKNKSRIRKEDLPLLLAQRVACVRAKANNHQLFLFYLINNQRFESYVFKTQTGSSVPHISKTQIENFEIPKISYTTQQKIASVLSALDDKIESNNKINAELEAMAKTIYDYWFVQFDFPDAKGKPYKSSGGKMVWNAQLKREVPEGWKVTSLQNFIASDKNGDWGKEEPEGNYTTKVECIRGTDINGIAGKGEVKTPVRYILEKNEGKMLSAGDLVIEISGGSPVQSTGRLAYITREVLERFENPLICSNFCKAISLKKQNQLFYFIYSWNRAYDNGIFFGFEGKTSGIKNLLFDTLVSHYKIADPPKELLEMFQKKVALYEMKRQKNLRQNQQLSQLRDWLLPMLMNGQVTVGTAYKQMEAVLDMVAEDKAPYGQTVQLTIPKNKAIFAKQILAGKIVSLFKEDKHFTHIKFQKLQFLAEHIGEADLALNYYFQSAGPYDNRFMHTIFDSFKKSKWFDKNGYKFIPLEKQNQINGYYEQYFKPVINKFNKLFKLLENLKESTVEIIATVYAVWNNRIILKQEITEELIITDFYNWSDRKQRYAKKEILEALKWLKLNRFEPCGFGKEIKKAKSKS